MFDRFLHWYNRCSDQRAQRRLRRDAYWDARRRQALAAQRRRKRLEAMGPIAKARMERKEAAREKRRYEEYQGARGLMIGMCTWAKPQSGSLSIKAFILIAAAIAWMFMLMLLPLMFIGGFLQIFAQKLFDLPGLHQLTELLMKIACSKVFKAVGDAATGDGKIFGVIPSPKAILGGLKSMVSSVGDAFSGVVSAPFKVLSSGLKTAGGALNGVPIVGGTLSVGMNTVGSAAATVADATGAIVGSIPSAIEAGLSLAQMGIDTLKQLQHFSCSLELLFEDFRKAGLDKAFETAISCANWPSYLGPLNSPENSTKEGRAKYCVDGKNKNAAQSTVPSWLKPIYQAAAQQYNVPWELLAAVNWNDTEYGAKELNSKQKTKLLKVDTRYASDLVNLDRMFGISNGIPLPDQAQQKFLDYYNIKGERQKGAKDRAKGIIDASRQVVSEWQQPNPLKMDRAGWIPLSRKEWDKAGGDWGNTPPDWRSSPYPGTSQGSPQACPMPISTEGTAVSGINPIPIQNVAGGGAFTRGQTQFTERLAAITGLDVNVVRAWVFLEMNNSYAMGREAEGNHNWLNIGYFNDLRGAGAFQKGALGRTWKNPITAADATAAFLENRFLGPSVGIQKIIRSVGMPPRAQIAYIGRSGWATSAYETQILGTYKGVKRVKQPAKISVRWTHPITGKVFILGRGPEGAGSGFTGNDAPVETRLVPDGSEDTCDPVDSVFALAHWLSLNGAAGDSWNAALAGGEGQAISTKNTGSALMIGDEFSKDLESQLKTLVKPIRLSLDAQSGRTTAQGVRQLRKIAKQQKLPSTVVFALGNNNPGASGREMASWIRGVRDIAGKDRCVIWPTIWAGGKPRFANVLNGAAKNSDNLVVVRWDRVARQYIDKNDPKGFRLNDKGIIRYSEMIAQAMNQCAGGSAEPASSGLKVTGKASSFGAIYDDRGKLVKVDPNDVVKGTNIPLNPACPGTSHRKPGVAIRPGPTWQSSILTKCGWWWIKSPSGKTAIIQQNDVGPNQSTGRKFDLNDRAVKLFGYRGRDSFPTDQGTWTGVYLGKTRPGRVVSGSRPPASLTLEGDSLSSDAPFQSALRRSLPGWRVIIDAKSGRGVPEGLSRMKSLPLQPVVVFALGSNSWNIGPKGNRRWIQNAMQQAGAGRCVVLTTVVTGGKARTWWNSQVSWAAKQYGPSRVQVADWVSRLRRGDIRLSDGTHPATARDEALRAQFIAEAAKRCAAKVGSSSTSFVPASNNTPLRSLLRTDPPKNFNSRSVPPLSRLAKPNQDLPSARWVLSSAPPLKESFPSFRTGLRATPLQGRSCQDQGTSASPAQQGVFYSASKAFGIPWQILSAYSAATSLYGCNGDNFSLVLPGYETDAGGDGRYDPADPVDATFSNARSLYSLGASRDPVSAARKLSGKDTELLMKMASVAKQLGYNTTGMVKLLDDGIGMAVSERDHLINKNTCPDQSTYVECIASLYRKILGVEDSSDSPGGWLTGGCNPPPVPDTSLKPYSLNSISRSPQKGAYTRSKDMKGLYLSNNTWVRRDALAGEQAAIRTFLACNRSFAKNWRANFVNDWGAGYVKPSWDLFPNGHKSHRNGADNDLNIPAVTDFVNNPGAYNRKLSKSLARMLFRAGAVEIYFNDGSVEEDIARSRAQFLRSNPGVAKKLSGRLRDRPLFWQKNHANHFHIRWYTGVFNSVPANVKVWLTSGGVDAMAKQDGSKCRVSSSPYGSKTSSRRGCSKPPPAKQPQKKKNKGGTNPYSAKVNGR